MINSAGLGKLSDHHFLRGASGESRAVQLARQPYLGTGAADWPDRDEPASRLTSRTATVFTCTS